MNWYLIDNGLNIVIILIGNCIYIYAVPKITYR